MHSLVRCFHAFTWSRITRRPQLLRRRTVEFLAYGTGVTRDHLPAITTLLPDVHEIEITASVVTVKGSLLSQDQTNDREILAEPAGSSVN